MNRPLDKGGDQGDHSPPTFSKIVICQGCFPGNWLLCNPGTLRISSGALMKAYLRPSKYSWCIASKLLFNPFNATSIFLYPPKTSESQSFSGIFRAYRKKPVVSNGLKNSIRFSHFIGKDRIYYVKSFLRK